MRKLTATLVTATALAMLATVGVAFSAQADGPKDERARERRLRIIQPSATHGPATAADTVAPKDERAMERGLRIVKPAEPVNAAPQVDPGPASATQPAAARESGRGTALAILTVSALLVALTCGGVWLQQHTRSHPRQAI
jgi:hypothetical protein